MRPVSASKISLVKPLSQPLAMARPLAAQGKLALVILIPCAFAEVSVTPTQATSGAVNALCHAQFSAATCPS